MVAKGAKLLKLPHLYHEHYCYYCQFSFSIFMVSGNYRHMTVTFQVINNQHKY